jgi:two-component system, OmpR family, alkaline phosphatase synthesis response regulator PhoP
MTETAVMSEDPPLPPSKILVADDNAQNRELLEAYMEELPGVTLVSASDGQETLDKVAAERPDLILLDIMMPRKSGFEVCKTLKADPATKDIPIIMVTALNETGDIERAVEVGTNDYITKPVNRVDLLARVKSLLRVRHVQNQLDHDTDYLEQLGSSGDSDRDR